MTASTYLGTLQGILGNEIASKLVTPKALTDTSFTVDGETVNLMPLAMAGEAAHNTALALPNEGALISGDALYDQVHLFLGEPGRRLAEESRDTHDWGVTPKSTLVTERQPT